MNSTKSLSSFLLTLAILVIVVFTTLSCSTPIPPPFENDIDEWTVDAASDEPEVINCGGSDDVAVVDSLTFDPPNPVSGQDFVITTRSTFKETVYPGALLKVNVKYRFIPLRSETYQLCDYIPCPAPPGTYEYSMKSPIPGGIPKVKISFKSESETVDGRRMSCFQGFFQIQ